MNVAATQCLPGVSAGVYGEADFEAIRALVHREAGIVLPPGKAMLVYSRLAPLVRKTASDTFARYIDKLRSDNAERHRAICALTTNHTFFYREAHHFEHFEQHVRGPLIDRLEMGEPVRIWSAGCSSGEEIWSLLMTMLGPDLSTGRKIAARDLVVLASDLANHALDTAKAARYPADTLDPVPARLRDPWVNVSGDMAAIGRDLTNMVRFRELNLLGEWPMKRKFDVIFCRNVMIYFDQPTKERLVERFAQQLLPGGHLYIGHSERVSGRASHMLEPVGNTIYCRVGS
ncbi:MAG: protein-glutamate O-methyltransferase CheR [Blastomonas sp.]